jgi:hypothetical protein
MENPRGIVLGQERLSMNRSSRAIVLSAVVGLLITPLIPSFAYAGSGSSTPKSELVAEATVIKCLANPTILTSAACQGAARKVFAYESAKADRVQAKADVQAVSSALIGGQSTSTLSATPIKANGTGRTIFVNHKANVVFKGTIFTDSLNQSLHGTTVFFTTDKNGEVGDWCASKTFAKGLAWRLDNAGFGSPTIGSPCTKAN